MHSGHRERLKKKFIKYGADSLETHELLELLLFYGIPRKDTNELAHVLINTFGSLPQVFDAPINRLLKINGIGESTAVLIRLVSKLSRVYAEKNYETNNKRLKKEQIEFLKKTYPDNKLIQRVLSFEKEGIFEMDDENTYIDFMDYLDDESVAWMDENYDATPQTIMLESIRDDIFCQTN